MPKVMIQFSVNRLQFIQFKESIISLIDVQQNRITTHYTFQKHQNFKQSIFLTIVTQVKVRADS